LVFKVMEVIPEKNVGFWVGIVADAPSIQPCQSPNQATPTQAVCQFQGECSRDSDYSFSPDYLSDSSDYPESMKSLVSMEGEYYGGWSSLKTSMIPTVAYLNDIYPVKIEFVPKMSDVASQGSFSLNSFSRLTRQTTRRIEHLVMGHSKSPSPSFDDSIDILSTTTDM